MPNPLGIGGQKAGEPSRNPKGRPPGTGFRARLFELLAEEKEDKIRAGIDWLFELVANKDFAALKLMLDFFGAKDRGDYRGPEEEKEVPNISLTEDGLRALAAIFDGKKVIICEGKPEGGNEIKTV